MVPGLCLVSLFSEQWYLVFIPFIYTFIFIPSLDIFTFKYSGAKANSEKMDYILYAVCFAYLVTFVIFLLLAPSMSISEIVFKSLNMGIAGGVIGINCGHELGHRSKLWEQIYAKILLFSTSYTHFYIEHNKGHHKRVATLEDPATSRLNESLYAFLPRSILYGWLSAVQIEKKKNGILKNKVIHYAVYQVAFFIALYLIHANILIAFLIHSFISIFLLESVNYIEHYGILRKKKNDRYEKVTAIHSWNSNHLFSRIHLFELSRHSHHHAIANKPFYELESIEQSPQMPYGYAGMILMAYIPPLWFKVMNPLITKEQRD